MLRRMLWHFVRQCQVMVLAVLLLLPAEAALSDVLYIDSANSVIHTTNWGNWDWGSSGPPDDAIDLTISGTMELVVVPGAYDPFLGTNYPDRIHFNNLAVTVAEVLGRTWQFPTFDGFFFAPSIEGSEDPCFGFGYYSSGSCWSAGNFGWYAGTYDGHSLFLKGGKNPDWFAGTNGFFYQIIATQAPTPTPEPGTWLLLGVGLAGLVLLRKKITA